MQWCCCCNETLPGIGFEHPNISCENCGLLHCGSPACVQYLPGPGVWERKRQGQGQGPGQAIGGKLRVVPTRA